MATETQTKLVGFCLGNKSNYNATTYANHIWFDPTNKQILLNGIEYIPKKLSELVNDGGFLTSANFKIENTSTTAVKKITIGNVSGNFYTFDQGVSGNMVLAGATSSSSNTGATFRKLVEADIPALSIGKITNLQSTLDTKLSSITKAMVEGVLTGNITSHTHSYLPLSGGTMSNTNLVTNLNADLLDGYHASSFLTATSSQTIDLNEISTPSIYRLDTENPNLPSSIFRYGNILTIKAAYDTAWQLIGSYNYDALWFRRGTWYADGTGTLRTNAWKVIAFTDSNVASASKWENARTITLTGSVTGSVSIDGSANVSLATTTNHTHSEYLPLTGGTLTGALTCNGDYINMNNDSGSRGYRGFFNQSNSTSRASGSHIFMYGGGEALGTNSVSIGYQAYAGIRNKDSDATTYPYIAWQWMPTEKFMVDTTNSATLSGGEYYGFPLLPNEMVQWSIGGQNVIYENSSSYKELLVVIKASDADTGLVFGGKTTLPYNASKTLIAGKYIVGSGEYLKKINEYTINGVKYYQVIIYTWSTTAFPTSYDFTQQVKVMCATKVSNSNHSGASSYASGSYSVASGNSSVASGNSSVASGNSSVASGYSSVASGNSSVASGSYSVASGYSSVASGISSVASGISSVASGNSSVASGSYSVASGISSVASGYEAKASHSYSFVAGYRCSSGTYFQTVIGRTNKPTSDAFIIGNGSSDNVSADNAVQSNCFTVDWNGNVTAKYFSGYANAIGGEGIKVYATNSNEINFGGTSSADTIYFGYRSMDSRPTPTKYVFGADGTATLLGSADMLDGYHEIKFFRHRGAANSTSISYPPTSSDLANITGIGSYVVQHSGHSSHLLNFNCEGGSAQYIQFLADYGNRLLFRCSTDSNLGQPWKTIAFTDSNVASATTATKLKTPRTLWGNSFDGSGSVSGDLEFVASGMTSQASHGMRIGSTLGGFIGFSKVIGMDGVGSFTGISLGWGKDPETDAASVRINNSIFTYKSYPILHSNNFSDYAPTKTGSGASGTWGISISGNASSSSKWENARTITLTGSVTGSVSIDGSANVSLATTTNHTHSEYLPLTGGTLTGALTCNGDYINMNNDSGSRGYRGFFNQSNSTSRASGSHIFMKGGGEALGTNSVSIGYQAYAGIRNKDSDATTYPYIAWQWMPTEKFMVDTTNSATLSGGEYYGFPLLPNEMVQWSIGGQNVIYENSSSYKELLVVIKASDADTGLVFGGKTTLPYNASKTLIAGKYIVGSGEYLKKINEYTINGVKYYQVIIYTWSTTAFPTSYDFTQQVKVMCATKVSNSNHSGASSYASGSYSVASGNSSVASGNSSVASGYSSVASGISSVASGISSVASGNSSVASGYSSVASGISSVASGNSSVASGYSSVASGISSVASGISSVASGISSVASGSYSVASGISSVASGYEAKASHSYSFVAGYRCSSGTYFQTVIGRTNKPTSDAFIIGNGSSDNVSADNAVQSNCFTVDWNGNVTAKYFSGYANAIGGEGFKIYAENNNQINFGGTSSARNIYFGFRSMDSRPTPTKYVFGANGTAILEGLARRLAYTSISENADINTYINEGVYSTTQTSAMKSLVNAPTNRLNGEMRLEVISSSSSTTYIIQKFWSRSAVSGWKLHIRTTSSDGWTAWKEIALTDSSITGNAATATKLKTPRNLWGNSFDGSASISGDIVFAEDKQLPAKSTGMRINPTVGFIGFSDVTETVSSRFDGISLGWGANPEKSATSVRINANTFTYKTYPILHSNNFNDYVPTKTGEGASGTWGISISGNAATATALTSSAGSATQPIYFSNGKPVACSYTLAKSVPSNAVFTDTTYSVATSSANGLMSSAMFNAKFIDSVGVKQGLANTSVDGTVEVLSRSIYIRPHKTNVGGSDADIEGSWDVAIPNATKDYDGSMSYTDKRKLDGISPYAPKKVVALRLSFNADATVTVIRGGGDYDMTQDAELMGSKYVKQTSTNNLYLTTFSLDTAAASTNTLNNLFRNSFVKFSFMGKSTDGISDYSITVKSNFDDDLLEIQFVSTKQDDSWVVDCVWELF